MNEKNRQTHSTFRRAGMLLALIVPLLTACGGGGGGDTPVPAPVLDQTTINNLVLDGTTATTTATVTYTIGGTVNSVIPGSTLVLQNNGVDNLTISADGSFSFPTRLANGATYNVTVLTHPANQVCAVTNASGKVSDANVANVAVSCHAGFSETGGMVTARSLHTITLLQNGKVLVVGGWDDVGASAKAELYDPSTGTWMPTGNMTAARESHTATLLPDGKVLVIGGYDMKALSTAEVYDPATGIWSQVAGLGSPKSGHSATLLGNGMVLVAGGTTESWPYTSGSAELYNPANDSWATTGSMATKRVGHKAVLLDDGKVLVAGGGAIEDLKGNVTLNSAELYDPLQGTWTTTGNMAFPVRSHTMTKLPNGTVLVTGGSGDILYDGSYFHAMAEVYDPALGTWTTTGSMSVARAGHTTTLLRNGKVLVAGGFNDRLYPTAAELYDPNLGTWSATGGMKTARAYPAAILLNPSAGFPDGQVLISGGGWSDGHAKLSSAELYW